MPRFALSRKLLIIPALALGVVVFILLARTRQGPRLADIEEAARPVRVIAAPSIAVRPRAVGWGNVEPGMVWEALSEVSGKIVDIHPELKKGAIIPKDTVILRIDPTEYRLAASRGESEVQNLLAQLRELEQKRDNLSRSLEVERESLRIARTELDRRKKLVAAGTIAPSEVDQQEQQFLVQQNKVQELVNNLDLIPSEREALGARLESARSSLSDARLDVDKTAIRTPFDCRIAAVNVELSQFTAAGQVLVKADSIASSEVLAHFPPSSFKNLMPVSNRSPLLGGVSMDTVRDFLGLEAVVRLHLPDGPVVWDARFSRPSETMDPKTRTIGIYVTVDSTYLKVEPGRRPPLMRNMYCEVELKGKPMAPQIVVPRSALHQGVVYVVGEDNRLERRAVTTGLAQGGFVVVTDGLAEGEMVVVTDLIPAVDGMLLGPEPDLELLDDVKAQATGEAPLS